MLVLQIDDRWSVSYDPKRNDSPHQIFRHGEFHSNWDQNNMATAMFYSLLEAEKQRCELENLRMFCKGISSNIEAILK